MKILFLIPRMNNGGAERVIAYLANEFSKNNSVKILTLVGNKSFYELNSNVKCESLNCVINRKNKITRNYSMVKNFIEALRFISKKVNEFKPDVVIGCGGYVTFPVIKAAKKLGIKTFIHEQNSIPGKSNIHLSKYADLVGISFKNSKSYFSSAKKVVYTGNPCGENALTIKKASKVSLGFKPSDKLIIIVAGSLGSETLNNKFKAYLSTIDDEKYKVLYITGKNYYDEFVKDGDFSKNVKVVPYYDNLASIMKDAYLIISRAGASTISEILALKIPSILIPSPYVANNHQYYNALDLANMKVSELIEEKDLNSNIIKVMVNELVYNDKLYSEFKNNLEKLNIKESSSIIYDEIKEILK